MLVDGGGYFPEEDSRRDAAGFLMDAMKMLGTDAVGVGSRDLRFGRAFLEERVRHDKLPVVCANLLDKRSRKPLFSPYTVKRVGGTMVVQQSDRVDVTALRQPKPRQYAQPVK